MRAQLRNSATVRKFLVGDAAMNGLARIDAALTRRGKALSGAGLPLLCFLACCAGAASAFAFAPFYFLPALAIGFSFLVMLLDGVFERKRPRWAAFGFGFFFGFGYFLVGLYWIAFSFFVQAEEFAWMAPFAVLGMSAFLGIFPAAACIATVSFWKPGWRRVFVFAFAYMLAEYARGHILTGLPWNLPSQALAGGAVGIQSAAWVGTYGLSLVVLLLCVAPVMFWRSSGRVMRGVYFCLSGFLLLFAIGAVRLTVDSPPVAPGAYVRIIQPNIPQREKIDPDLWSRNFARQLDMSRGQTHGPTYVIWPENAAALIDEADFALEALSENLSAEAVLITGAVRRSSGADGRTRYYNSLAVIEDVNNARAVTAFYDKHHLVPFGEYLPLQRLLRTLGLAQLAPYEDGFTPGPGPQTLDVAGASFAPLICYEAIFPGEIYPKEHRPAWLVTVTNDAWFGDSAGPRQHLDQARLRAVETGLPMARSANTGVSALFDGHGRLLARTPLYETGRIDHPLPGALAPTIYSRFGDLGFLLLSMVVLIVGVSPDRVAGARRWFATFARWRI